MLRSHLSRVALLASVAVVMCAGFAYSQAPASLSAAKLQALATASADSADFKENKRAAIPFKPIEMQDPKTGRRLSPADTMTLSNGKKVKASDYFAELNSLEKKFNEYGYSLRKKNGIVVFSEAKMPIAQLNSQSAAMRKGIVAAAAPTTFLRATQGTIQLSPVTAAAAETARLQKLTDDLRPTKPVDFLRTWNYEIGKRSLAAGFIDGKLQFHGDRQIVKLTAEANAGGYLVNNRMVLLQAKGSAESPAKGNSRATLNVTVKGQSIFNLDKSIASNYTETKKLSRSFDQSATFRFSIGPIPVSGRIGVRGSAGVDFTFAIRQAHATMNIKPNIDSKVYAQFGVDLYLVSTGIGGDLTLVKDTLDLGAEVGLDFDSKGAYISQRLYLHNNLEMLSGSFYLYVRVNYLFGSDEFRKVIWNWDGLRVNGYLFNINNKVYLNSVGGGVLATK